MNKTDPTVQTILTAGDTAAKVVYDATETAKGVVEKATQAAANLATSTREENERITKND